MNYMENIDDKEAFFSEIKKDISQRVMAELDKQKQVMANEFLKAEEDNESE
mgnify:CR=1 FL=1